VTVVRHNYALSLGSKGQGSRGHQMRCVGMQVDTTAWVSRLFALRLTHRRQLRRAAPRRLPQ